MEMLQCDICEARFKSEMALTGHQIAFHGSRDSHPCKLCPATFSDYSSLTAHITSVHLKPKPFACLKCSESFMTIQGMMEHITVHEEQNLSEEIVHEEQNQPELTVHEEEKHISNFDSKRNGKVFEVEEIVKERSSINGIEYFVKWKGYPSESNTWEPKENIFDFKIHDEVFEVEDILKERSTKNCIEYFVKWKGYSSESNTWEPKENILDPVLIQNYQEKLKSENKNVQVIDEQKSKAESVHDKKKPYKCTVCDSRFVKKLHLKRHNLSVHDEKKVKNKTKHVQVVDDQKIKPESVHDKKKPYKCLMCDSGFSQKSLLKKHIKLHEEKPYKCFICNTLHAGIQH